ncbi:hypothetical protein ACN28E_45830 [Archangium lansingense]|uniref:hypothetical protein n=1 Tax=Archangium lansingense TaxID=2995310 RepID=UPI003B8152BA
MRAAAMQTTGTAALFEKVAEGELSLDQGTDALMRRDTRPTAEHLKKLPRPLQVLVVFLLAALLLPLQGRQRPF